MLHSKKLYLVGNPNSGKTSVFNSLTGLYQKVGNFAGVTVDKKTGHLALPNGKTMEVVDLAHIAFTPLRLRSLLCLRTPASPRYIRR